MNKRKETTATRFAVETEIGVAFVIQAGRNESRVILNRPAPLPNAKFIKLHLGILLLVVFPCFFLF